MGREVLIGGIEIRLVAMGLAHSAEQVVRNNDLGHAAEEGQGAHV